jgi:hypothetical protein
VEAVFEVAYIGGNPPMAVSFSDTIAVEGSGFESSGRAVQSLGF